jgi:hypothetical protein
VPGCSRACVYLFEGWAERGWGLAGVAGGSMMQTLVACAHHLPPAHHYPPPQVTHLLTNADAYSGQQAQPQRSGPHAPSRTSPAPTATTTTTVGSAGGTGSQGGVSLPEGVATMGAMLKRK